MLALKSVAGVFFGSVVLSLSTAPSFGQGPVNRVPDEDFIRYWLLCGPFPAGAPQLNDPDTRHLPLFETDYLASMGGEAKAAPLEGQTVRVNGEERTWKKHETNANTVDLDETVSKAEGVLAYAYTELHADTETACILAFGSNDGARIWLNGERVWDYTAGRTLRPDQDLVPVVLRAGRNRLLIKVEERGNRWGFACRFLPLDEAALSQIDLFKIDLRAGGPPVLRLASSSSLLGRFIKRAEFEVYDARSTAGAQRPLWSRRLRGGPEWPINLPQAEYGPYRLVGNILLADNEELRVEQTFTAGPRREHVLFENGRSDYSIVLADDASESERWVVEELRRWIREAGGVELPVREVGREIPSRSIVVGFNAATRNAFHRVARPENMDESFVYRNAGETIYIWGGRDRGTMYGVLAFLERELGVRWYSPRVAHVPKRDRFAFVYLDHRDAPDIPVRNDFYFDAFDPEWAARNRINGAMGPRPQPGGLEMYWGVHTFYPLVPPSEFFAAHPEYYSLIDGRRTADRAQLCLTNKDVLDIVTERLLRVMREHPEYLIYDVSQNDWHGACQCDDCQAIARRESSESGPVLWFVNQVAERVEKEFPDKFVGTLAYQYTRRPPKTLRPRANVVIRLCSIECCFAHDFASCPENADFLADLRDWAAIAPRLYIWDYVVNFSHYVMPYPNFRVLAPNLRMFRDHNAVGVMEQAAYQSRGGEFAELRAWVLAKLLWDPDQDVNLLIDDFMYGYYGRAGQFVRAYFDLLHAQITPDTHIHLGLQADDKLFTDEFVRRADEMFDAAETVADNEEIRRRVEMARLPLMYLECKRDPQRAVYDGTYDRFRAIAERESVTHYAEAGQPHREAFHATMDALKLR